MAAQTFIRWWRPGVWERLLVLAQERGVQLGMTFLDGTSVRAHQKAAGAAAKGATGRDVVQSAQRRRGTEWAAGRQRRIAGLLRQARHRRRSEQPSHEEIKAWLDGYDPDIVDETQIRRDLAKIAKCLARKTTSTPKPTS